MEFCENELLIFYWIYDFGIIVKIFIIINKRELTG